MRSTITVFGAIACMTLAACARSAIQPIVPPGGAVALSGGPNMSMIYLARVPRGIIAIDLGWWGAERSVRRALRELGVPK